MPQLFFSFSCAAQDPPCLLRQAAAGTIQVPQRATPSPVLGGGGGNGGARRGSGRGGRDRRRSGGGGAWVSVWALLPARTAVYIVYLCYRCAESGLPSHEKIALSLRGPVEPGCGIAGHNSKYLIYKDCAAGAVAVNDGTACWLPHSIVHPILRLLILRLENEIRW